MCQLVHNLTGEATKHEVNQNFHLDCSCNACQQKCSNLCGNLCGNLCSNLCGLAMQVAMHVNRSVAICVAFRMSSRGVVPPAVVCAVANCVVFSSTMRAMPPDSHCAWNVNMCSTAIWMVSWRAFPHCVLCTVALCVVFRVVPRCVLCHQIAEMPQGRWSLPSLQVETRICPIDNSEVFQPNTNAIGTTQQSGSVSVSLPSLKSHAFTSWWLTLGLCWIPNTDQIYRQLWKLVF